MAGYVRHYLGTARRVAVLTAAVQSIKRLPPDAMPPDAAIMRVWLGWGNTTFSADFIFLKLLLERAVVTSEPILECGSGVSTLLLALTAGRRGVPVHSLENDPKWAQRIRGVLGRYSLSGQVHDAPLRPWNGFEWYDLPPTLPDRFGVVACDGPHHRTRGGRYGLLPVLKERIHGALILLDDAHRSGEQEVLEQWRREFGTISTMPWRSVSEVRPP